MTAKKIFILGADGFIGSHLVDAILEKTNWSLTALDLQNTYLEKYNTQDPSRLLFKKADIQTPETKQWIETQVQQHDIILPLVAIATPSIYVSHPLRVFELDFESNLEIVRLCVKYQKRLIFPSTSEVYGACPDQVFNEETSMLVTGPISKQRWMYSCAKQMLDRVIHAYGLENKLCYTLFRPFNWIGPRLDNIYNSKPGGSRVITQFIGNILRGESVAIVNGGHQRRCFTDINDGIDALLTIIENPENKATKQIFNIGNPENNLSILALAELLIAQVQKYPDYAEKASNTILQTVSGEDYFGLGYQDIPFRKPDIEKASLLLNWKPKISVQQSVKILLDYYLQCKKA